jgi:hypothetical protein
MNNQPSAKILVAALLACLAGLGLNGCGSSKEQPKTIRTSTTRITTATTSTNAWGEFNIFGTPIAGTTPCGSYCGYIVYNNGGLGFMPDCTPCYITLRIGGIAVPSSQYEVQWRYSSLKKGCATTVSTTQKQYDNVIGRKYTYTVYFRPGFCPPTGTSVEIVVECASGAALQSTGTVSPGSPKEQPVLKK